MDYCFENRKVFRLTLKETRFSFFGKGRERTFHVEGPKTEKAREPKVDSLKAESIIS